MVRTGIITLRSEVLVTIGERIKRLHIEKNMTQEELGAILGVKKATIQKYESGQIRNLKADTIGNIPGRTRRQLYA